MNPLRILWAVGRSAYIAFGRRSDRDEQELIQAYLSKCQSAAELERREHQLMRSRS
jgi:hypothetical protein